MPVIEAVTSDNAPTRRTDADDLPTIRGLTAGHKMFGRYVLGAEVGRGGMGVVWRAQDVELDEPVALKFLPEEVARDEAAVDALKAETRHARRLSHANIVRIHQFERDEVTAALSMEFVDGVTLSKMRMEQPAKVFSARALEPLAIQLCAALEYAHSAAKMVHRDLKPANLLATKEGRLKITDFGIARSLSDANTRLTGRLANTSGTLVYMSPQQLIGEKPMATDDIYALGATLYELLTGKPPFYTGDVATQIRTVNPPLLAERRAELDVVAEPIPQAWEEVILACLAKRSENRPQSADEAGRRLQLVADQSSAASGLSCSADDGETVREGGVSNDAPASGAGRRSAGGGCSQGRGAPGEDILRVEPSIDADGC
jgi:serine/threonine protein kinase